MKTVAVILSGCGVFDGSEIHESVLTLLYLDKANIAYQCLAPNISQSRVINHLTQSPLPESRNVLIEAARIARGNIKAISQANPDDYSAIIFPGGFGASSNLCDFADKNSDMTVQADVLTFSQGIFKAGKPMGFICIAPVMVSQICGPGIQQTTGNDVDTHQAIQRMGGKPVDCSVSQVVIDQTHKVVSTPAYMLGRSIKDVADGIEKLVQSIIELM